MASIQKDTPETLELIRLAQGGDSKAESRIVMNYESYVDYMVSKYSMKTEIKDDDDLRSYINMGLLDGIRKFDSSRNTTFIYYAHIWMKKHIFLGEAQYRFIRLPANKKAAYESFLKKYAKLNEEITYELDNKIIDNYLSVKGTLTAPFTEFKVQDSNSDKYEIPEDIFYHKSLDNFEAEMKQEANAVLSQNLNKALHDFSEREVFIIEHTYGINDATVMKAEDIANSLGLSKVYVNDVKTKVIKLLRHSSFKHIILNGI